MPMYDIIFRNNINSTRSSMLIHRRGMCIVVVVVVVVVHTLTRIIKSVVAGQAPVTLEWKNTPGKKHKQNQKWYTRMS